MNRKSGRCSIGTPTEPCDSNMPNVSCYNQSSVINTICNQNTFIKTTPAEMGWIWWVLQKWSIKKTIFVSGNNSIYGISASMFQNFFVEPIIPHILNSLVCKVQKPHGPNQFTPPEQENLQNRRLSLLRRFQSLLTATLMLTMMMIYIL